MSHNSLSLIFLTALRHEPATGLLRKFRGGDAKAKRLLAPSNVDLEKSACSFRLFLFFVVVVLERAEMGVVQSHKVIKLDTHRFCLTCSLSSS